jgi:general secretion pathway protein E
MFFSRKSSPSEVPFMAPSGAAGTAAVAAPKLDAAAPSAPGLAPGRDAPVAASLPGQRKTITSLDALPTVQALLTVGDRQVMRIPREFEYCLAAIETGPKKAAILYDTSVSTKDAFRLVLQQLRNKLTTSGYVFERGGDYPCSTDVIKLLLDDHISRHGGSDSSGDPTLVRSHARERFLNWLDIAVREGATDLHVQVVGGGRALVQIRVGGELENLRDERNGVYTELEAMEAMAWPFNSGSSKGSNSSSQWDAGRNLYCMTLPRAIGNQQISLRYQSLRGYQGPKMIARLLNSDVNAPTLTYEQLGYAESQRKLMLEVANMPAGFVIFSGVTGSGKTTTLKTFVESHPGNGTMSIYSMEDPVEYPMRGVHQITLQRDVADDAASSRAYNETVASLMRADPDMVIIGEIRDGATARAGQQIVETGHMALGTVHAHLASGIVPRLTNKEIGMSRDVLTNPNILSLLAYQALVPKLCPHCSFDAKNALESASEHDLNEGGDSSQYWHLQELLDCVRSRFKLGTDTLRFRNPHGCDKCNGRGTKGVTVVAELVLPYRRWLEFTREGRDYEAMVHYRQGSDGHFDTPDMKGKTIFEHTLYKAIRGWVDPRQCERFDGFRRFEIAPKLRGA